MLRKLIKYEWKRVWKLETILLLVLMVVSVLGAILFHTPMGTAIFQGKMESVTEESAIFAVVWIITFMTSIMVYVVMIIGATYGNLIYLGVNFFKTMYTDEGYLTHTLPVKPHQLLGSKFIVGIIWTIIMQIAVFASVFIMVFSMMLAMEPNMFSDFSFSINDVMELFELEMMTAAELGVMAHYMIVFAGLALVGPVISISMVYGGLTIGQLANKYKALVGIACYFGLIFLNQIIATLCQIVGTISQFGSVVMSSGHGGYSETEAMMQIHTMMFFSNDLQMILMLIFSIGLYFLSHYIITAKLNLN